MSQLLTVREKVTNKERRKVRMSAVMLHLMEVSMGTYGCKIYMGG